MFFTEEQHLHDITCQKCENVFVDPRYLPCGDCLCIDCIKKERNNFKCFFCDKVHSMPEDGFPVSKSIVNLLKKKPKFKFTPLNQFKNELEEFKKNLDSFNSKINMSSETLSDHCKIVRNEVGVKTESVIREIEKKKKLLLNKIDNYEVECQKRIKHERQNLDNKYRKYSNILDEYNSYLNNGEIEKEEIFQLKNRFIQSKLQLSKEITALQYTIFNEKKIKFVKYEEDFINKFQIGTFIYQPFQMPLNLDQNIHKQQYLTSNYNNHDETAKSFSPYYKKLNENDQIQLEVHEILSKLTPKNLNKLTVDLVNLEINTEERLKNFVDIIFEKSIGEKLFTQTYAKLCKVLSKIKVPTTDQSKTVNFRTMLLTKCQKEFNTDYIKDINYDQMIADAEAETNEAKKKEMNEKANEKLLKAKRRYLGNIRFIGELFRLSMLTVGIMFDCIERFLKQENDEKNLECLCLLLTTIGKELDKLGTIQMNKYFTKLAEIIKKGDQFVSARIRFMIFDVIELRQNKWVPCTLDGDSKGIVKIRNEAKKERVRRLLSILNGNKGSSRQNHDESGQPLKATNMESNLDRRSVGGNKMQSPSSKTSLSQKQHHTPSYSSDSSKKLNKSREKIYSNSSFDAIAYMSKWVTIYLLSNFI
jgi:predicted transcriptional regulator